IASAANGGGTNTTLALAPVARIASDTVLNRGTFSSNREPPLPGTTPATTWVPYSIIWRVWKEPVEPVIPWTSTCVLSSTKMLIEYLAPPLPLFQRHREGCPRG